jgi:hypothetical protein
MTQPFMLTLRGLAAGALLAASLGAQAQSTMPQSSTDSNVPPATAQKQAREIAQGDPARWFREDPSAAASLRRLQKEIGAALQEAQGACRKAPASDRSACMNEARAVYQKDMAGAKAQLWADANTQK